MTPILYPSTATSWANNGLGFLRDAINCQVTEERNGAYELEMQYPVSGAHYSKIKRDCIIKAKANDTSALQIFRVYKHSKPINGVVTFFARHLSYDLNGRPVPGFQISGASAATAMGQLFAQSVIPHSFQAWSNATAISSTNITRPCSTRSVLGGQQGSILQFWGGEYEFDNYTVRLWEARGQKTDVVIAYGKNLTDIKQEENLEDTYTHVMPFAVQTSTGGVETVYYLSSSNSGKLITLESAVLGHVKVLPLDLSDKFGEGAAITPQALKEKADSWILANKPETPKVNITASFVNLAQTENYKAIAPLLKLRLCDIVTVRFIKLGIDATAKVIKTIYDTLAERFISVEIGDAKSNFANTIIQQQQAIDAIGGEIQRGISGIQSIINEAIQDQTDLITGHKGGYFVIDPAIQPYRTLWMDTNNMATAQKVLQINGSGIGFSTTGINGPYKSAWTIDGRFNADFITTGTLTANVIRAGLLQDAYGKNYWNLDSGQLVTDGMTTDNINIRSGRLKIGGNEYYTEIIDGSISQYLGSNASQILEILPTGAGSTRWATLMYGSGASSIRLSRKGYGYIAEFSDSAINLERTINAYQPITSGTNTKLDLKGTQYITFNIGSTERGYFHSGGLQVVGTVNCTNISPTNIPWLTSSSALNASNITTGTIPSADRLPSIPYTKISSPPWLTSVPATPTFTRVNVSSDANAYTINSYAMLDIGSNGIRNSVRVNYGLRTNYAGTIYGADYVQFFIGNTERAFVNSSGLFNSSEAKIKTDIVEAGSALSIIENATIYEYKYLQPSKDDAPSANPSEDEPPITRMGLVIGDGYDKPPDCVLSEDGRGVSPYVMASVCWKALQELSAKCNEYEERIAALEEALNERQ